MKVYFQTSITQPIYMLDEATSSSCPKLRDFIIDIVAVKKVISAQAWELLNWQLPCIMFLTPQNDLLIWDVGHQPSHKYWPGRRENFHTNVNSAVFLV
jgi:deoxyxylulose-5-phosphate synthase